MYLDGGELVVSPTDLTNFLACRHLTRLDLEVATRRRAKPADGADEALALLFAKGMEHERRYLAALRSRHAVTEIDATSLSDAAMATEAAMRAGAPVIYQATFSHAGQRGHADFLLRTSEPSDLGTWSYDVADTKLARRLKVPALLQMAEYGHHLHRLQGRPPRWLTVVAGDGVSHPFRYADVEHYARRVGGRFTDFLAEPAMTTARPVTHCGQCRWQPRCAGEWRRTDHLSLVAGMRGDHREQLEAVGIQTVAALAGKRAEDLPTTIGRTARERLVDQAALQVQERRTGQPVYALLPPVAGLGLLRLPPPSVHDLYLDFEGDPYVEPAGREYLAGLGDRQGGFTAFWAHGAAEERRLTEALVDHLLTAWQADPQLHVYHYAAYEKSALQRLTARHGVREAELDVLLRAEVLVDLYAVVRQGLRISKESYSIKKLESFYWGQVRNEGDVADAMSSVVAYERWLAEGDDAVLEAILAYNRDDVESTRGLHYWLEQRRAELATAHRKDFDRPTPGDATAAEPKEGERAEAERADRLLDAGQPLLAGLVGWHRREARPAWWDVFRLDDLDDDELIDDASALGGVGAPEFVREVNRSRVWRYPFPPQDTKLRIDADALDVDHHHHVGLVVALAADEGWVELSLGRGREPPPVRGLGPAKPILDLVLRSAVAEVAERTLAGVDCLGARLLSRVVPSSLAIGRTERPGDAAVRIGSALDGAVLAVQGPPGTGKSTAGARLIRALLDAGLKVGVTALSHQVIGSLLGKVDRPALQKCTPDHHCGHAQVEATNSNAEVRDALTRGRHRLVGGTAWLWARPELRDSIDVLVIDEAGQFSLANAVAVSPAARSMVLLGDPQQLAQPSQAEHPYGAGVSALEHLLDGHATVPPERGIFLDTTWRMHPAITAFVSTTSYEDRLHSSPELAAQRLLGTGRWTGSGLRWLPVDHVGRSSYSTEEAAEVAAVVRELLPGRWIDASGRRRPLTPDDFLVVAPYNAQVARLRQVLDPSVRVGTVDKFQGREAAVVIYSLASSSAEDAPRGVDFLYDINRLNVAVSRARAMTILVGSPRLLDAEVHHPHQLRLINALCRYVDLAEPGIASS